MAHFTCNFISYVLNRAVDVDVIIPGVHIDRGWRTGCHAQAEVEISGVVSPAATATTTAPGSAIPRLSGMQRSGESQW